MKWLNSSPVARLNALALFLFVIVLLLIRPVLLAVDMQLEEQQSVLLNAVTIASLTGLFVRQILLEKIRIGSAVSRRTHFLEKLAYRDSLTTLPNRRSFLESLQRLIVNGETTGLNQQVLLLDLDDFKYINDTYGHDVGDALLQEVSRRFSSVLSGDTLLARLGGDEFVMSVATTGNDLAACHLASAVKHSLHAPVCIDSLILDVSASIGISSVSTPDMQTQELLKSADEEMYRAKRLSKGNSGHQSTSIASGRTQQYFVLRSLRRAGCCA